MGKRRLIQIIGAIFFVATSWLVNPVTHASADDVVIHRIVFPAEGKTSYSNDFGAPRSGHTHQGNDIMGSKMLHEVAAASGTITSIRFDDGTAGNFLQLRGDDGWIYWYMHINNDTPGTDDGVNDPQYAIAPGISQGTHVDAGQFIAYMGDSGNAETTGPHLHFEMHKPDGTVFNPYPNLRLSQGFTYGAYCGFNSNPQSTESVSSARGYWALGSDGGVFSFGNAPFYGSTGGMHLNKPIVGMASTPTGNGYWLVASDGGIFSFGDANFYGSTGAIHLNQPIVGMSSTKSGHGYWLVASDGGIFSFGDANFYGSTGAIHLNQPMRGMARTASGNGYWMYANDGGIFSFGDAQFYGSIVNITKTGASGMAPTKTGNGYWIVGNDGGIFSFGGAQFYGSIPGTGLCSAPTGAGFVTSASGSGYFIQTLDGKVWSYGDAKYYGSLSDSGIANAHPIGFAIRP